MGVEPDDADTAVARGEALDRADVRAAAAPEDERALGKVGGDGERLLAERLLVHDRGLRVRQRKRGGLDHRLAAVAPRAGHAHEPGAERAAAGVALVLRPERDGRVGPAVGAARAQAAQPSSFS